MDDAHRRRIGPAGRGPSASRRGCRRPSRPPERHARLGRAARYARPGATSRPRPADRRRAGPASPHEREADVGMRVPDLGALLAEAQMRRMALDATGAYFVTNIDPPHAEDFAKSLLLMAVARRGQHDQPITVYINSGGGSVGDGLAMMEMINRMRRQPRRPHQHGRPRLRVLDGGDRQPGRRPPLDRPLRDPAAALHAVDPLGRGRADLQGLPGALRALPADRRRPLRPPDRLQGRRVVAALHLVGPRAVPRAATSAWSWGSSTRSWSRLSSTRRTRRCRRGVARARATAPARARPSRGYCHGLAVEDSPRDLRNGAVRLIV